MEFSFNMTAQDYYTAWKIKDDILNKDEKRKLRLCYVLVCILILLAGLLLMVSTRDLYNLFYFFGCIFVLIVMSAFKKSNRKKAAFRQYNESAIVQSRHTLRTYSEGLEIINSYEKMFVPWKSIFYASENNTHFIIFPTYAKGIIAIDKARFSSPELDRIKAEILTMTAYKGGSI